MKKVRKSKGCAGESLTLSQIWINFIEFRQFSGLDKGIQH